MSQLMKRIDVLENELGVDARIAVEDWEGDLHVLRFMENRRGGDPIALAHDGRPVFPDKYRGGDDVLPGETWLCDVTAKNETTRFAAPVWRIDRDILSDLSALHQRRIAEALVEDAADVLKPLLREIAADGGIQMEDDTGRLVAELENLRGHVSELEEQYDDAAVRVRQQELEIRTLRQQVQERGNGPVDGSTGTAADAPAVGWLDLADTRSDELVVRLNDDVLESRAFTADRYYGHVSPNSQVLFFKPHQNGNLPCVNGRLTVPQLSQVLPYEDAQEYTAKYDARHGGWFVRT